jgi:hypothetical protein
MEPWLRVFALERLDRYPEYKDKVLGYAWSIDQSDLMISTAVKIAVDSGAKL